MSSAININDVFARDLDFALVGAALLYQFTITQLP
jgi:hypothetical protein